MYKAMFVAAALVAGAVGVSQIAVAQDVNPKKAATEEKQAATEEMKVTGTVARADLQKGEITIGHKS